MHVCNVYYLPWQEQSYYNQSNPNSWSQGTHPTVFQHFELFYWTAQHTNIYRDDKTAFQIPKLLWIEWFDGLVKIQNTRLFDRLNWKQHTRKNKINCPNKPKILKILTHNHWGTEEMGILRVLKSFICFKLFFVFV